MLAHSGAELTPLLRVAALLAGRLGAGESGCTGASQDSHCAFLKLRWTQWTSIDELRALGTEILSPVVLASQSTSQVVFAEENWFIRTKIASELVPVLPDG